MTEKKVNKDFTRLWDKDKFYMVDKPKNDLIRKVEIYKLVET